MKLLTPLALACLFAVTASAQESPIRSVPGISYQPAEAHVVDPEQR